MAGMPTPEDETCAHPEARRTEHGGRVWCWRCGSFVDLRELAVDQDLVAQMIDEHQAEVEHVQALAEERGGDEGWRQAMDRVDEWWNEVTAAVEDPDVASALVALAETAPWLTEGGRRRA